VPADAQDVTPAAYVVTRIVIVEKLEEAVALAHTEYPLPPSTFGFAADWKGVTEVELIAALRAIRQDVDTRQAKTN